MPNTHDSEAIILKPGDTVIPKDIMRLREAADQVSNGITHEALRGILEPGYATNRDHQAQANAKAARFAFVLRNGIYHIKTTFDLQHFATSLEGFSNSTQVHLVEKHLLDPDSETVEYSPGKTIRETLIPDILWYTHNGAPGENYYAAYGRAVFPKIAHGFPKQLTLPRTARE